MKNRLLFFFLYQLSFLAWCFKLHQHFFDFTTADQASLTIVALLPLLILRFKLRRRISYAGILLLILPLVLMPLIDFGLRFISEVWVLLYILLFVSGSTVLLMDQKLISYLGFASVLGVWFIPYSFEVNQKKYFDRLIKTISSRKGETDIVTWKNDQWYYYNNSLVSSSVDGHIHTEVLAHTTLPFFQNPKVLLIGDDLGLTRKEIGKYNCDIKHLPYDFTVAEKMLSASKQSILDLEIMSYLESAEDLFDVIIIDLPDPELLAFRKFYEPYFLEKVSDLLSKEGILITNAGGYYTDTKHYQSIEVTLQSQGLETQLLQTLVPTLGHRVWVMASTQTIDLDRLSIEVATTWINEDAIQLLQAQGKESYPF